MRKVLYSGFTGKKEIDDVSIRGIAAYHDAARGGQRGKNSVHVVKFEDIIFCHLGDLGHELPQSQVDEIGAADVLFVPVGGIYTIGPEETRKAMELIKPGMTVPMHYKLAGMSDTFDALSTVEDFICGGDNVRRLDGPTFTIDKRDLRETTWIVVPKLSG